MALKASKQILRKEMKQKLRILSATEKETQSRIVTDQLFGLSEYKNAKSIALYLSMDDEINTEMILKNALAFNKKCYIPRYFNNSNKMDMVRLTDIEDYNNLPRTKWNIKQPDENEQRENALDSKDGLDFILIPGLAFTVKGERCGRGKGYYDTFLSSVKSKQQKLPFTAALAFKQQVIDYVPTDDHDVKIDVVLFSE